MTANECAILSLNPTARTVNRILQAIEYCANNTEYHRVVTEQLGNSVDAVKMAFEGNGYDVTDNQDGTLTISWESAITAIQNQG